MQHRWTYMTDPISARWVRGWNFTAERRTGEFSVDIALDLENRGEMLVMAVIAMFLHARKLRRSQKSI